MPSLKSLLSALSFIAPFAAAQIGGVCEPLISQKNPISGKYLTQNTGTINSTIIVVPINYTQARAVIPSQYPILQKQYQAWLPNLPAGQYPAILQMELHSDLYSKGQPVAASGNNYVRASVSFPFVDRLNDGYTAMTYSSQLIVSSAATSAQSALSAYGYTVAPGYFAVCNAYEYENATANLALPPAKRGIDQAGWANTNTNLGNPDIAYRMVPIKTSATPYSMNFYFNVTNQPLFGGSSSTGTCDFVQRIFNTDLSEPPFPGVFLQGDAAVLTPYFTKPKTIWTGAYGLKLDVAYHESPNVQCSSLKGFHVNKAPA